ncbi:MAG: tetratricopeptide repeat protein [Myxococcota bacterium]
MPVRRLLPIVVLAVALLAALQAPRYGLTDAAREAVVEPSPPWVEAGPATDGVAVWSDWLPMAASLPATPPWAAHVVQWLLWGLLALGVWRLGRAVGARREGAVAAAVLVAAHPLGVAAHADVAGRGPLIAILAMVWALALSLGPRSGPGARAWLRRGAVVLVLLAGLLAHPMVAVTPVVGGLALWTRWRRATPRLLFGETDWPSWLVQVGAVGIWLAARAAIPGIDEGVAAEHLALGADGEVGLAAGCRLVARGIRVAALGAPLVRRPWDVDWASVGGGAWEVWVGGALLVGLPIAARLVRTERVATPLWWTWALLLAMSQIAEPLPSAQPPALLVGVLVGLALLVGAVVRGRVAGSLAVAGAVALVVLPTARAATWFATEGTLLRHELATVPYAAPVRAALARRALEEERPRRALDVLGDREAPEHAALRVRALLDLHRWGSARRALEDVDGDGAAALRCEVAAASRSLDAVDLCRRAVDEEGPEPRVIVALARALERSRRSEAAEAALQRGLERHPDDPRLLGAAADLYEDAGWMRQAVDVLERWYARTGDPAVRRRLVDALGRKGRGDRGAGRHEEAVEALERALELAPERHALRYPLAEALEELGEAERARTQRETARGHGAQPPRRRGGAGRPGGGAGPMAPGP